MTPDEGSSTSSRPGGVAAALLRPRRIPPLVREAGHRAAAGHHQRRANDLSRILGPTKTTQILFGGDGLDGSALRGPLHGGLWLDDCETKAIEVSGFFLGTKTESLDANSAQFPDLARPFFSDNRNSEFAQLTAFFNDATGSIAVRDTSDLWGVEANARCKPLLRAALPQRLRRPWRMALPRGRTGRLPLSRPVGGPLHLGEHTQLPSPRTG